jgi:ssDNA-binding Zn-finger/Zn-ribbon topoisomerase 1
MGQISMTRKLNPDIGYQPCPNCDKPMIEQTGTKNDHWYICQCGEILAWDD